MASNKASTSILRAGILGLLSALCLLAGACSSDDGGDDGAVGGTGGTGGIGGGAGGVAAGYWPEATFTPTVATPPTPYHANDPVAAVACMPCHSATGVAQSKFVFGGTVFLADGVTPAPGVEVGVSDGTNKYFVHTAANGMYWATGTGTVNWATADIRLRNAAGERPKAAADDRNADCDSCHIGALILKAP